MLVPASQSMRSLPSMRLQNMMACLGVCLCHPQGQAGEMKPGTRGLSRKSARPIFPGPDLSRQCTFGFFSEGYALSIAFSPKEPLGLLRGAGCDPGKLSMNISRRWRGVFPLYQVEHFVRLWPTCTPQSKWRPGVQTTVDKGREMGII